MTDQEFGTSGLPRDIEEFVLLSQTRAEYRSNPTAKMSLDLPVDMSEELAQLAADLGFSRADVVAYLIRQSGERMHWLRQYVNRPKERT